MDVKIQSSWKEALQSEFEKDYFVKLTEFVRGEYKAKSVYPPGNLIFNAFDHCPFDKVKVVIIGQDPYHGPGQAHGLCFSVNDGVDFPPSLLNIFKEIERDLTIPMPKTGKSDSLGRSGRIAFERFVDCGGAQSRLASGTGLGNVYRCRYPQNSRRKRACGFYALGKLCATKRCCH